jgi:N6-L-threonylcarbamoyladenine synthase
MMGLSFPCGRELEKLAETATFTGKINIPLKDGNPCFSGAENKAQMMLQNGAEQAVIARFVIDYITAAVKLMLEKHKTTDTVVFAGGVMSNNIIRKAVETVGGEKIFAEPGFSADNAAGTAIYSYLKNRRISERQGMSISKPY